MARNRDYLALPDVIVHAYNRGVDARQLYLRPRDYETYLELLMPAQEANAVSILGHALMSNHFHLVLHQHEPYAISRFMYQVCRPYTMRINKRLKRSGPLFDGRYKATVAYDAQGLLRLLRYIDMNPVEAGLAKVAGEWRYSSAGSYLTGCENSLEDRSLVWALVGGAAQYARFLDNFDPADPPSAREFLYEESDSIWEGRSNYWHKRA